MTTKNGQVAWLSANTQRVFISFEDALEDANQYLKCFFDIDNYKKAYDDVYLIHLWLNEK